MGNAVTYVGLDLETSGTDISAGSVPIQVGVSLGAAANMRSLIGGWEWDNDDRPETWDERAALIHNIDRDLVGVMCDVEEYPTVVDRKVASFLTRMANVGPNEAVLVGWNVGTFDFPFVRKYLPNTAALCSYRFVDLNALCFSMAEAGRRRAYQPDQAIGAKAWKARAKKAAERMMGGDPKWHDAGYDATASLLEWSWLVDRLDPKEGRPL